MRGLARNTDPNTSHEAAGETDATRLECIAWKALRKHGGWLTYFQWSKISGIKYSSITPRGKSLWLAGRVRRKKLPGLNDLGKIRNLMHFKAKKSWILNAQTYEEDRQEKTRKTKNASGRGKSEGSIVRAPHRKASVPMGYRRQT